MAARIVLMGGPILSVCAGAIGVCVLSLQEWLGSRGVHKDAGIQSFPTELCTLTVSHFMLFLIGLRIAFSICLTFISGNFYKKFIILWMSKAQFFSTIISYCVSLA